MEIRLSSLKFSLVWEPFYELKLYFPLSMLPRTFYILTESFIAVHLFHILVPLKLLGEYHLVLAICYNSCYWFVLHKTVRMTALCRTKGLATSVSFSDNTRCWGKIIGKKEKCQVVPLNSPLALNHLWFRDGWTSNRQFILTVLVNFSSTNLTVQKKRLDFSHLPDPITEVLCTVYCNRNRSFCFVSWF